MEDNLYVRVLFHHRRQGTHMVNVAMGHCTQPGMISQVEDDVWH